MKRYFSIGLPSLYLLMSFGCWIVVVKAPPDGLANLPLVAITLPSIIVERALTQLIYGSMDNYLWGPLFKSLGMPTGYLWNHFFWFIPIIIFQAFLVFKFGRWIENRIKK